MSDGDASGPAVRERLPCAVERIENVFIPLADGCRIAARIWLPASARDEPVPAILEYIPYRKRDFMRARDEPIHGYFAGHGYAAVRVDVRGTGDSEGVLLDEYSAQEHADALEIIAWLAAQPWCDGGVGMMGISWGGFNALQVAALRPPALRAVISLCSTDDRYADDAHYMGGCLLNENLQWGAVLMTYDALPPDPRIVGERWRELWLERLDAAVAFPEVWMRHPWRDEYWQHGSVCEDFSAIECPVYAVGGWADGYSNAIPRLLAGLRSPRKGLIGPWAHVFPHDGVPGPAIGFLQEALRWWDQWLRGKDRGLLEEPMLRVWMQDGVAPEPQYAERPGRWVAEVEWPSPRLVPRRWHLNPGRLDDEPTQSVELRFSSPQTTGSGSGEWCAFGADGEMPLDQRADDGRSLAFDGAPLREPLEILGAPTLELELAADAEVALLAARLCDVAPDGASTRVSYGLLNLCHRDGHAAPTPLAPGRRYRVALQLNDVAHRFAPGHQLRLALSTSYWPIAWPPPQPVTLSLFSATSTLTLPERPPSPLDDALAPFPAPEQAEGPAYEPLRPLPLSRTLERDLTTGELVYTLSSDGGELDGHSLAHLAPIEMDLGYTLRKQHRIPENDPLGARSEIVQRVQMRRPGWAIAVETSVRLAARKGTLHFEAELRATENGAEVRTRRWDSEIPRRLF